jgi:hypothetical protein
MPVQKGPGCVEGEMRRFHQGQLHSGKGGKVVSDPKQAKAIALSACGQSKYSETLQSMGYPEDVANAVTEMFAETFLKSSKHSVSSSSFEEPDWQKQFETGKGPGPENPANYEKDKWFGKPAPSPVPSKAKRKNNPVQDEPEMLSGPALPKGPGNPQGGSSKEVFGLRMLG